ncbi:MAG: ribonuclease Z [Arenibacter sp.]|nr:ribonuclease Z [Arenibacter sp.]
MILDKEGNVTTVLQENISLEKFISNLKEVYPKIEKDHIILNLFSFTKLTSDDILEFLQLSDAHRKANKSFVLVTNKVSYADVPESICVVPTIQEAKDIVEMEEIERDLGI